MIQIKVVFAAPCSNETMTIDLETAVRTLVCVAMGQHPRKRIAVDLIVAVLARKFSAFTEEHITELVIRTVVEEGGTVDVLSPAAGLVPIMQFA